MKKDTNFVTFQDANNAYHFRILRAGNVLSGLYPNGDTGMLQFR